MLYTLDEDELKECTLAKEDKTRSHKDDFSSKFCYGRATNDEFTCYGQLRIRNMISKQIRTLLRSMIKTFLMLSSLILRDVRCLC